MLLHNYYFPLHQQRRLSLTLFGCRVVTVTPLVEFDQVRGLLRNITFWSNIWKTTISSSSSSTILQRESTKQQLSRYLISYNYQHPSTAYYRKNLSTVSSSTTKATTISNDVNENSVNTVSTDGITTSSTATVNPTLTLQINDSTVDSVKTVDVGTSTVETPSSTIINADVRESPPPLLLSLVSPVGSIPIVNLESTLGQEQPLPSTSPPPLPTNSGTTTILSSSSPSWKQTYIPTWPYIQYVVKREINLLQYHGITKYVSNHYHEFIETSKQWRQQRNNTTTTTTSSINNSKIPSPSPLQIDVTSNGIVNDTTILLSTAETVTSVKDATSPSDTTAKVPFVITMKMRYDLMNIHGYTIDAIRQMTPQRANMILLQHQQHQQVPVQEIEQMVIQSDTISNANHQPQIQEQPQTVNEFHANEMKDSQTVQEFHHQNQNHHQNLDNIGKTETVVTTATKTSPNSTGSDINLVSNVQHQQSNLSPNTTTWYELVESSNTNPTNDETTTTTMASIHTENNDVESNVVALYLHEKDAQFALSIYEELAQRKHFEEIHKIHDNYQTTNATTTTPPSKATGSSVPTFTIRRVEKE